MADVTGWSLSELDPIAGYETALVIAGAPAPICHYLWSGNQQVDS
jgi:hypothetical protein